MRGYWVLSYVDIAPDIPIIHLLLVAGTHNPYAYVSDTDDTDYSHRRELSKAST